VVMLLLFLLVVWLTLMGVLAIFTLTFQGYVYTEPVKDIQWRAPLAGGILGLFLTGWVFLDYSSPGNYRTLLDFNYRNDKDYDEFRVVTQENQEEVYKILKNARGRPIYRKDGLVDGALPPNNPKRVIVNDNGKDVVFEPDLELKDTRKKDKKEEKVFKRESGQSLYYRDKQGRLMEQGEFGYVKTYRIGQLILNLLLNAIHFILWFVVLWLVLEHRGPHAFGLAIVFWLAVMIFLVPQLLNRAEDVAGLHTPTKAE
jgi:hypothetical protein